MLHYVASPEHTEKHMAEICDSLLERPEIRPTPLSDLCHPVQKRDVPSALPPAPLTLSHDGNSGKVSKRTTRHCVMGHPKMALPSPFVLSLGTRNFFSYVHVPPSSVSVSACSPMQISPSLPTPPTYPSLSTGGATAPLQGHGRLSAIKCSLGPKCAGT